MVRNAPLPPDGVHLHPESKEFGNLLDGGDVLQEESFDDLDIESQEIPTNEGAGGGGEPSSSRTGYAGGGYHFHTNALDEAEILIDLDPTSSDEEYVAVPMPTLATMGVAAEQEQSTEEIYPFAWALDGRRIGESESNVRPGSPSVPTFSLVSHTGGVGGGGPGVMGDGSCAHCITMVTGFVVSSPMSLSPWLCSVYTTFTMETGAWRWLCTHHICNHGDRGIGHGCAHTSHICAGESSLTASSSLLPPPPVPLVH